MQPQQPGRPYRLRPTRLSYALQASSSAQNSSASSAAPGKGNEPNAQRPAHPRSTRASTAAAGNTLLPGSKLPAAAPVPCTSTPANEPEGTACLRGHSDASEATAVAAAKWSHKVQQAIITQSFSRQAAKLQRHTTAAHVAVKHGCGRSMAAAKDAAADAQQKPEQQRARGGGRSKH